MHSMISTVPFLLYPWPLSLSLFVDAQVGDEEGGLQLKSCLFYTHVSRLAFMNPNEQVGACCDLKSGRRKEGWRRGGRSMSVYFSARKWATPEKNYFHWPHNRIGWLKKQSEGRKGWCVLLTREGRRGGRDEQNNKVSSTAPCVCGMQWRLSACPRLVTNISEIWQTI